MIEGLVSIIIPVYNEEKYIRRCLNSLALQTFDIKQCEILIVDGLSTDDTIKIIEKEYSFLKAKILKNEKRIVTYALNIGIDNSSGEIIIRLDAHAEYDENYIERCIYYITNLNVDNVGGIATTKGIGFSGEGNAEILSSIFGVGDSKFRTSNKGGYVDTVPFGTFKRTIFDRIGKFNVDLPRSEDNDINSRIRSAGGKVYLSPEIRFTYYCRDTFIGLLSQGIKNGNSLFLTLKKNKKAMSLRHFIPFLFFSSLLLLPLLSIWLRFFIYAFLIEVALYLSIDIVFSIKGSKKHFFYKMVGYFLFHFLYGLGSFLGLLGIKLY